jgi:DnaJ-class molecular chaperone
MKTQTPITGPGLAWAIGQIHKQFEKALAPKPNAVKTDTKENPARCHECKGNDSDNCQVCNGDGDLPDLQSVDMTVSRDFDQVPVQVSFDKQGKVLDAWVVADVGASNTRPPRWANGESIELTPEEEAEARETLFPTCTMCKGDGECWITEDQANVDCPYCGGRGFFLENSES